MLCQSGASINWTHWKYISLGSTQQCLLLQQHNVLQNKWTFLIIHEEVLLFELDQWSCTRSAVCRKIPWVLQWFDCKNNFLFFLKFTIQRLHTKKDNHNDLAFFLLYQIYSSTKKNLHIQTDYINSLEFIQSSKYLWSKGSCLSWDLFLFKKCFNISESQPLLSKR